MVSANVEPADIVTHDDEDVRRALLLRGRRAAQHHHSGEQCQHKEPGGSDRHVASPHCPTELCTRSTSSAQRPEQRSTQRPYTLRVLIRWDYCLLVGVTKPMCKRRAD